MNYPTLDQVLAYAVDYTSIPVGYSIWSDSLTPIQLYKQIAEPYSFLLESVEGGEKWARYSFIGHKPFLKYEILHGQGKLYQRGKAGCEDWQQVQETTEPIALLKTLLSKYRSPHIEPFSTFSGGAVGYLGYETVHVIEPTALNKTKPHELPEVMLYFCTNVVIFDHFKQEVTFVEHLEVTEQDDEATIKGRYAELTARIQGKAEQLLSELDLSKPSAPTMLTSLDTVKSFEIDWQNITSNFTEQSFIATVDKIKSYIQTGDIFQAVISQEFNLQLQADPLELYRVLRKVNPAPYLYYFDCGDDLQIVGSSPERLVQVEGERIETNPIAGTRKRGRNPVEDQRMAQELLQDEKEQAEHVMLVDLGRNDVGKVAEYGSVKVTKNMELHKYAHVMHLVSEVEGRLQAGYDSLDALLACFPAGTVSGAPKVRAMQIINELENQARGIYAGAIGYFSFSGNLDSCIAIRTIVVRNRHAYIQAGAGVVADSKPELEWKETRNKARALLLAVQLANHLSSRSQTIKNKEVEQYV